MKNIFLLASIAVLMCCCEQMNDKHDEFLARGETVYIGKVDSVTSFPGNGRLLLRYWLSDPRAKKVTVYWGVNNANSKELTVDAHERTKPLDLYFESLAEGNYTFKWISGDQHGNKSMVFEKLAAVYGPLYQEKILNRRITETKVDNNDAVSVTWAGASSDEEIGVEIFYTDKTGKAVKEYYAKPATMPILTNIDYTKGATYRTLYKPEPTAIDTFYTNPVSLGIVKSINVSQGKPVTASDILDPANATQQPANAVDGKYGTSDTRWVSTAAGEHWLEIDLQGEYSINSFKTWNGSTGYNNPIAKFSFQAWVDGAWKNLVTVTGNTDAQYGADFTPVTTSKVRFYAYNQVRLYEIAVYSLTRF